MNKEELTKKLLEQIISCISGLKDLAPDYINQYLIYSRISLITTKEIK